MQKKVNNLICYTLDICSVIFKRLFIKDVRSQKGGSLSSADILLTGGEGMGMMRTSAFYGAKLQIFSKIMVCPHEQGRSSQCGQVGRSQFFAILCGRLLWTASNRKT